jgi:hypothetical protein
MPGAVFKKVVSENLGAQKIAAPCRRLWSAAAVHSALNLLGSDRGPSNSSTTLATGTEVRHTAAKACRR